jgi:histidinol-phosphatase (PHP family)
MHSHHSHSGDYVAHASDTLETITDRAVALKFDTFCLTEHMPRLHSEFLYPEEIDQQFTVETLVENFDRYYTHAIELQKRHFKDNTGTKFLVGMEVEGLDLEHIKHTSEIRKKYDLDLVVGSVHYVKNIPIDFDRESFLKARDASGGDFHSLFKEYFELQYLVLTEIKPEVVGHFDLIRLFVSDDDVDSITGKRVNDIDLETDWPDIWRLVTRNLEFVKSYGGLIELNSAAIRKGWVTPYPKLDIARAVIKYCDGKFCLSDDCHSIAQVGLNYDKVLTYLDRDLKLDKIWYLDVEYQQGEKKIISKSVSLDDVKNSRFFQNK